MRILLLVIMLCLSSPLLAQFSEPNQISVTIDGPKADPDYYYAHCREFRYITVYSPERELFEGQPLEARRTEARTYRTTVFGNDVWVYVNRE